MIFRLCQSTLRTLPRQRPPARQFPSLSATHAASSSHTPLSSRAQTRCYLGGAGEMKSRRDSAITGQPIDEAVAKREQELWDKAQPRYDSIMERHLRMPTVDDMADSAIMDQAEGRSKEERELDVRKKRLIYRSKQRGWLEVDLLLGTWAAENVTSLSLDELDQFERFVNLETIDIYNVVTLRSEAPDDMRSSDGGEKTVVEKIQEWAKESPLGKASMEKYVEVKTKHNLI
mmetsp:Transcript_18777/g.40674  ORF Transcript_18777/g.40674 Transcript_18777/m.40674 type:complete len:231 (+) Transcript_18777:148-840(+)